MWNHVAEPLEQLDGYRIALEENQMRPSHGRCLDLLANDREFRGYLTDVLRGLPIQAFRWETPPITEDSREDEFEFVVVSAPELEVPADVRTFSEYFASMGDNRVGEFPNLSGDAQLIVPGPIRSNSDYNHLRAFLDSAPERQIDALWEVAAKATRRLMSHRPVWLNTAGAGVAWLHIRLDQRPKYYVYEPYRNVAA